MNEKIDFIIKEDGQNLPFKPDLNTAVYSGNFSEYSFSVSKTLPGFLIVSDKVENRDSSDLIGENVKILVFKDCQKNVSELKQSLESIEFSRLNDPLEELAQKEEGPAFEIIEEEEPAFEIIEEETNTKKELKNSAHKFLSENDISQKEEFSKKEIQNDEKENFDLAQNVLWGKDIKNHNSFKDEEIDPIKENIKILRNVKNKENYFADKLEEKNNPEESYINEFLDENSVCFGKNINLNSSFIENVEVIIYGFNENEDNFKFSHFPTGARYKYSIAKDKFSGYFYNLYGLEGLRDFIKTFIFKGSKKDKKIIVFVDGEAKFYENFNENL